MKRDCHQAFDSQAVSHRRFHSVCDDLLSTDPSVDMINVCQLTHVIFKFILNDLLKLYLQIKSLKFVQYKKSAS